MKDIYTSTSLIIVLFVYFALSISGDYMYIYLGNVFDGSNGNKNCIFTFSTCFSNTVLPSGASDRQVRAYNINA